MSPTVGGGCTLGAAFGIPPDSRLNAQHACDPYDAKESAVRLPEPLLHAR